MYGKRVVYDFHATLITRGTACLLFFLWCSTACAHAVHDYYGPTRMREQARDIVAAIPAYAQLPIHWVVAALHKKNPHAFLSQDTGWIRKGVVLQLPDPVELRAVLQAAGNRPAALQGEVTHVLNDKHDVFVSKGEYDQQAQGEQALLSALRISRQHWTHIAALLTESRASAAKAASVLLGTPRDSFMLSLWRAIFAIAIGGVWITLLRKRRMQYDTGVLVADSAVSEGASGGMAAVLPVNQEEGDYDFWGSRESLDSHIDLARSYIDMDQSALAKEILREVIRLGSDVQTAQATALLNTIKA